jgi:hypothetical protein
MSDNVLNQLAPTDSNSVIDNVSGVQPYDGVVDANFTGMTGTMIGGKRRKRRRTRGKRHTLKKARKVKSRKLRSRRARRRRGKRSRRRRRGGSKGCVSGTSSYALAGNTLQASESMLANPPSAFSH